jgi:hypothetical protein
VPPDGALEPTVRTGSLVFALRLSARRQPERNVKREGTTSDSLWSLRADLVSAKALVWVASVGREGDLTPEAHLYFCDRYRRLAQCHRIRGRIQAARRAEAKADEHCGSDGPPYAAAMAMPRPRRFVVTNAVGKSDAQGPDDAA